MIFFTYIFLIKKSALTNKYKSICKTKRIILIGLGLRGSLIKKVFNFLETFLNIKV